MRDIPVFIINGFLDSGKTSFIIETIAQDEFYKKGRTLIIMCEDGEIEYHIAVTKKEAYHQFGNSVAVPVIKRIAAEIVKQLL